MKLMFVYLSMTFANIGTMYYNAIFSIHMNESYNFTENESSVISITLTLFYALVINFVPFLTKKY